MDDVLYCEVDVGNVANELVVCEVLVVLVVGLVVDMEEAKLTDTDEVEVGNVEFCDVKVEEDVFETEVDVWDEVDDLDVVELCELVDDEEAPPHGTALQSGVYLDES